MPAGGDLLTFYIRRRSVVSRKTLANTIPEITISLTLLSADILSISNIAIFTNTDEIFVEDFILAAPGNRLAFGEAGRSVVPRETLANFVPDISIGLALFPADSLPISNIAIFTDALVVFVENFVLGA